MADQIRLWSDELARDPSSAVFLQLGEALRRQGQLDLALKVAVRGLERHPHLPDAHDLLARIAVDRGELQRAFDEWDMVRRLAPDHVGAVKGLAYVCFQQGRTADAERYLADAAALGAGEEIAAAMARLHPAPASSSANGDGTHVREGAARPRAIDSRSLFADLLGDHEQTALLLDAQGLVMAGIYLTPDGQDVGQEVGAELSGVSDAAVRATRHLEIGDWRSIVVETDVAVVNLAPADDGGLVVLAASRATPMGLVRRVLARCVERAHAWIAGGGSL